MAAPSILLLQAIRIRCRLRCWLRKCVACSGRGAATFNCVQSFATTAQERSENNHFAPTSCAKLWILVVLRCVVKVFISTVPFFQCFWILFYCVVGRWFFGFYKSPKAWLSISNKIDKLWPFQMFVVTRRRRIRYSYLSERNGLDLTAYLMYKVIYKLL